MHYELWALNTGNLMSDYDSESEVLATVRALIANGWDANDLGVRLEWDDGEEGDDDQLPPALYGAVLAARANGDQSGTSDPSSVIRRSA